MWGQIAPVSSAFGGTEFAREWVRNRNLTELHLTTQKTQEGLQSWHQRCHMLIESETKKDKAPEVRHVIGSNPFQQRPNAHGIGDGIAGQRPLQIYRPESGCA